MGDTFLTGVIAPLTAQASHELSSKIIARNFFVFIIYFTFSSWDTGCAIFRYLS